MAERSREVSANLVWWLDQGRTTPVQTGELTRRVPVWNSFEATSYQFCFVLLIYFGDKKSECILHVTLLNHHHQLAVLGLFLQSSVPNGRRRRKRDHSRNIYHRPHHSSLTAVNVTSVSCFWRGYCPRGLYPEQWVVLGLYFTHGSHWGRLVGLEWSGWSDLSGLARRTEWLGLPDLSGLVCRIWMAWLAGFEWFVGFEWLGGFGWLGLSDLRGLACRICLACLVSMGWLTRFVLLVGFEWFDLPGLCGLACQNWMAWFAEFEWLGLPGLCGLACQN